MLPTWPQLEGECKFVVEVHERLTCSVCTHPMYESLMHVDNNCGCSLCGHCFRSMQASNQACPNCVRPLTTLFPNRDLAALVSDIAVVCLRCSARSTCGRFPDHFLRECMMTCSHCQEGRLTRESLASHLTACLEGKACCVATGLCRWTGTRRELAAHLATCVTAGMLPAWQDMKARLAHQEVLLLQQQKDTQSLQALLIRLVQVRSKFCC